MKHVFLVHGHITYYLAKSIQEYKKIPDEDCLLLPCRGYKNEFITMPSSSFAEKIFNDKRINAFNFFNFWKYIDITDNEINTLLNNQQYALYIPHVFIITMQILATNKNCVEVNFIEEGSPCYSDNFFLKPSFKGLKTNVNYYFSRLFSKLGIYGKGRFVRSKSGYSTNLIEDKFKNYYTISEAGFLHALDKRVVVPLYKEKNMAYSPKYTNLFILDGGVELNFIGRENFNNGIDHILTENPGTKQLSVKFHPAQKEDSRKQILDILNKHNIEFEIIPGGVSMEQLLVTSPPLVIYGFSSSILLYALMIGHKIVSYDRYLQDVDAKYRNYRFFNDFSLEKLEAIKGNKKSLIQVTA